MLTSSLHQKSFMIFGLKTLWVWWNRIHFIRLNIFFVVDIIKTPAKMHGVIKKFQPGYW